jgi:competence protein ComEC
MKGYWHLPAISVVCSLFTVLYYSVVFFLVLLLWLLVIYRTKRLGKIPLLLSLAIYLFFSFYFPAIENIHSANEPTKMSISGQIIGSVTHSDKVTQFNFRDEKTLQMIKVSYFHQEPEDHSILNSLQPGASCQMTGDLSIPDGGTNPGQFNYQNYLATSGIQYEMKIASSKDMICHATSSKSFLFSFRETLKKYILQLYSSETGSWISALVLGDDSHISEAITELFQDWGLSHILAISGLHIGLVVGLFYFLTIKLNVLTKEKAQLLIIIFLPLYAVLAGGEPSVWRATLMVIIVIILQKVHIRLSTTDIISVTFLLLLLADKYLIYHVGFQFSFLVSFGIILSRKWIGQSKYVFFQLLRLSFVSQMIIVPLQIIYFYSFNPLSILLNVIVVPYFSLFVIPCMFLLFVIAPIHILAKPLEWFFTIVHQYVFLTPLEFFHNVAYFPWWSGFLPPLIIILYYGLFLMMMYYMEKGIQVRGFICGVFVTLVLLFSMLRPYLSPFGTVTVLDIGQGDAIVIELPFRKGVLIVDAGAGFSFNQTEPSKSNYSRIIKPFLRYKGIQKIDGIVISHEDTDHAGSVNYIVDDFEVKEIIISTFYQLEEELKNDWLQRGVSILRIQAGDFFDLKGKRFTILSPGVDKKGTNENSLVMLTELGNKSWLFTGDIDQEVEREIIRNYPNLMVDVLKIAHHGSKTSTDPSFITELNPTYALISVGKHNRYGHPSSEVISILEDNYIHVFRTDEQGAIIYQFSKDTGTFYPFKP